MGILDKLRTDAPAAAAVAAAATAAAPQSNAAVRPSNGLKDFLWLLGEPERGRLLDLGPVANSTVEFFTKRKLAVTVEDVLHGWRQFMRDKEASLRNAPAGTQVNLEPAALAQEFLGRSLQFDEERFHAVLAWDLLDYLDKDLLAPMVARLNVLLRPGGVLLAIFHNRAPEPPCRYRVVDAQHIEVLPHSHPIPHQRSLQNRDILNLFSAFRSSKTYVAKDQIREAMFSK